MTRDPTKEEMNELLKYYQLHGETFSKDKECLTLISLLTHPNLEVIYKAPTPSQTKRGPKSKNLQALKKGEGVLATLIAKLDSEEYLSILNPDTKQMALFALLFLLEKETKIVLTPNDTLRVGKIFSSLHELLVEEEHKRKLLTLSALRGFKLEPREFWLKVLKDWHSIVKPNSVLLTNWLLQEETLDISDLNLVKRALSSFNHPELSLILLEISVITEFNDLLQKKSTLTQKEIETALGNLQKGIDNKIFSPEHEILFLSNFLKISSTNVLLLEILLNSLQISQRIDSLNEKCREKVLQALIPALGINNTLNLKKQREAIITLLPSLFPHLSKEEEKRKFIKMCVDRSFSWGTSREAQKFLLETLQKWHEALPQEIKLIEWCSREGKKLCNADGSDFSQKLQVALIIENIKSTHSPKLEWFGTLIQAFPENIKKEVLLPLLENFLITKGLKQSTKLTLLEWVFQKDATLLPSLVKKVNATSGNSIVLENSDNSAYFSQMNSLALAKESIQTGPINELNSFMKILEAFPKELKSGDLLWASEKCLRSKDLPLGNKLTILELIAQKDAAILDLLIKILAGISLEPDQQKELANWLIQTEIFNQHTERKDIKELVMKVVTDIWSQNQGNKKRRELLLPLGRKYLEDLRSIDSKFWIYCFHKLARSLNTDIYDWFHLMIDKKLFERGSELEAAVYSDFLFVLCGKNDVQILRLLAQLELLGSIYHDKIPSIIRFEAFYNLIKGSCTHLQKLFTTNPYNNEVPDHKSLLTNILSARSKLNDFIKIINTEENSISRAKKQDLLIRLGEVEVLIIQLLYITKHYIDIAFAFLTDLCKYPENNPFYEKSWRLLEFFSKQTNFEYKPAIDELLSRIANKGRLSKEVDYTSIFEFLLRNPSYERHYYALMILRRKCQVDALVNMEDKSRDSIIQENWNLFERVLTHVLKIKENRAQKEIMIALSDLMYFNSETPPPNNVLYDNLSCVLLKVSPFMKSEDAGFLANIISSALYLSFLELIPFGLVSLSRIDLEMFIILSETFWQALIKQDTTNLLKAKYVEMLMEVATVDHPFLFKFLDYIQLKIEYFSFKKSKEIKKFKSDLLKLYNEKVIKSTQK